MNTRIRARRPASGTQRLTVQLSNVLADALDQRAAAEALPFATVIRRAITWYLSYATAEAVQAVDPEAFERKAARGRRGPAVQWPVAVSYVLDAALASELKQHAKREGESVAAVARRAAAAFLTCVPAYPVQVTRLEHGFITYDQPDGVEARIRKSAQTWHEVSSPNERADLEPDPDPVRTRPRS